MPTDPGTVGFLLLIGGIVGVWVAAIVAIHVLARAATRPQRMRNRWRP